MRLLLLLVVIACWGMGRGRRWDIGLRRAESVVVVMFVRVKVRMRVGRVGKRMWLCFFI